jgi:hypothetical protein
MDVEAQQQEQINPNRCHICPLTQDTAPRTPAENIPWMYLQCGHRIHTNCFLERSNDHAMSLIRFSCPVCQEHALTNNMIQWIEAQEQYNFTRANTLQTLWNENHEFREDIKNLSKIQRTHSSVISNHNKECIELRKQWNRDIHTSMEFIRMKTKEYYTSLKGLPFRKKALYGINIILRMRNNLIRKYPSLNWYHYSIISRISGAPKLKRYSRMSAWLISGPRLFNLRSMKI